MLQGWIFILCVKNIQLWEQGVNVSTSKPEARSPLMHNLPPELGSVDKGKYASTFWYVASPSLSKTLAGWPSVLCIDSTSASRQKADSSVRCFRFWINSYCWFRSDWLPAPVVSLSLCKKLPWLWHYLLQENILLPYLPEWDDVPLTYTPNTMLRQTHWAKANEYTFCFSCPMRWVHATALLIPPTQRFIWSHWNCS